MKTLRHAFFLALTLVACGDDSDRIEVMDRMRTIGTTASPLISEPSEATTARTVQLTVYVALPEGETASVEAFRDLEALGSHTLATGAIHPVAPVESDYQNLASLRLLPIVVTVDVPTADELILTEKGRRVRYGLRITSSSGRVENIVGSFLVYPAGSEALTWQSPTISLAAPANQESVRMSEDGIDLKATVNNPEEEGVKVGWFVTSGKISARRARDTVWLEPKEGRQTIIATVRGKKTRGFGIQVIEVNVTP